jgi:hypothetical protein
MPTVKSSDSNRNSEVEQSFALWKLEVLDGDYLKLRRPAWISVLDATLANAIARDERSIAWTCPYQILRATSRAAASGPQPISRTGIPFRTGNASTTLRSRSDKLWLTDRQSKH